MAVAEVNGMDLYYESVGTGPPLILIHGALLDHQTWAAVVPRLAASFEVVSYDLRGHSRSGRGAGTITGADHASDLEALIELLDRGPVHAVGQSLGGMTALRLAGQRGELFRSVAAHEPPFFNLLAEEGETRILYEQLSEIIAAIVELVAAGDQAGAARSFVEHIAAPGGWELFPTELQQTFIGNISTIDDRLDMQSDLVSLDPATLAGFKGPVLLTRGDSGAPWFAPTAAKLATTLPTAQLHTISGAGHGPQMTHPAAYIEALTSFITENVPRPN